MSVGLFFKILFVCYLRLSTIETYVFIMSHSVRQLLVYCVFPVSGQKSARLRESSNISNTDNNVATKWAWIKMISNTVDVYSGARKVIVQDTGPRCNMKDYEAK